jgi:2-polyprenyl-3-methyl-5-hydroxy-6-metoxy-1,4-benzoquinol methylase
MNNKEYWEKRYRDGGDSGEGSHDPDLVMFKAGVVNSLIHKYGVRDVIDFGCGDGNQIQHINVNGLYLALDVSSTAIELAKKFEGNKRKCFQTIDIQTIDSSVIPQRYFDMALSLDVVFHLVDDNEFEKYMKELFNASNNLVVIYSSNEKLETKSPNHIKHRVFKLWVNKHTNFELINVVYNPFPEKTFCNFYIFQRK